MKKIIISLSIIVAVGAVVIGGTYAFFYDTETSAGNIFTAGSIDLKVDHLRQTYNDVDCKTCSVEIKSDTTNMVVNTVNGDDPVSFPHSAVAVSNPHPAWTVSGDIPDATWIWATDPVTVHDAGNTDVYYTFEKTFTWWGPVTGVTLSLGVGTDNGYQVKLNGNVVGTDWGEQNYLSPADVYSSFAGYIVQGTNVLEIEVKNQAMSGGTPSGNPAGLLYKLTIDGNCGDDYFKNSCTLFGIKDLGENDHFWMFDDVKPGDHGTNVISLHVDSNDAYVCLLNDNVQDDENTPIETEISAGDDSQDGVPNGELSDYIQLFIWNDINGNGVYEPVDEVNLYEGGFDATDMDYLALATGGVDNLGVAWCMGTQDVNHTTGTISCSGAGNQDVAQTDEMTADIVLYGVQQRNNEGFSCANVVLAD